MSYKGTFYYRSLPCWYIWINIVMGGRQGRHHHHHRPPMEYTYQTGHLVVRCPFKYLSVNSTLFLPLFLFDTERKKHAQIVFDKNMGTLWITVSVTFHCPDSLGIRQLKSILMLNCHCSIALIKFVFSCSQVQQRHPSINVKNNAQIKWHKDGQEVGRLLICGATSSLLNGH